MSDGSMSPIPVIETERLRLAMPAAGHFPLYRTFYASASGEGYRYGGPKPERVAWNMLAADIGHWTLRGFGMWVIERRADGAAVGGCGLYHPAGWPSHELTWWLLPEARGQGYATEASRAAIRFGYETLGWPVVETHMRDNNRPARRLAERLGGTAVRRETFPDGVTRDVFALPCPGGTDSDGEMPA